MKNWKIVLFVSAALATSCAFAAETATTAAPAQVAATQPAEISVDSKFGKIVVTKEVTASGVKAKAKLAAAPKNAEMGEVVKTVGAALTSVLEADHKAAASAFTTAVAVQPHPESNGQSIEMTASFVQSAAPALDLSIDAVPVATFTPEVTAGTDGTYQVKGALTVNAPATTTASADKAGAEATASQGTAAPSTGAAQGSASQGTAATPSTSVDVNASVSADGAVSGTVGDSSVSEAAPEVAAPDAGVDAGADSEDSAIDGKQDISDQSEQPSHTR